MMGLFKEFWGEKPVSSASKHIEILRETGMILIFLLKSHTQGEDHSIYKAVKRELHTDEKLELAHQIFEYRHSQDRNF